MSTLYSTQNIQFTSNLKKPSLAKGTILVNDGTGDFNEVSVGTNGQILVGDSAETSGVRWADPSEALGFSVGSMVIAIPAEGSSVYFMKDNSATDSKGKVFPSGTCIDVTVNTDGATGYSDTPTNITGGTLDFTLGSVAADTAATAANWTAYSGGPHFQINGADIDTTGENFSTFLSNLDIDITSGQQVSMRLTNNLTSSADPGYNTLNVLLLFRAT